MQAPLQRFAARAATAARHATKKRKKWEMSDIQDQKFIWKVSDTAQKEEVEAAYKTERRVRKEEWEYGPRLAPRRDIGKKRTTLGTFNRDIDYPAIVPKPWRKPALFAVGDRVAIMKGVDKGKIGKVRKCDEERQLVEVEGLNQFNYIVPDFIAEGDQQEYTPAVVGERALHLDDVKLVTKLKDESGLLRDVVVEELEIRKPKRKDADVRGERWIAGLNVKLSWPDKNKDPEEFEDTDADTFRITVDEPTFTPTLQRPPMPPAVIDELRGKYSKFRTRHDPEYIAQKEAELSAMHQRQQVLKGFGMSPMEKASAQYRATKEEVKPLSDEQLASIGEVIARSQGGAESSTTTS
ncbi:Hypothetical protein D9617_32g091530 [Elsinoe fawcettii]|nr:Hypothetical protein D9617_32g091530 [Elsinoe fawcettii]